MSSGEVEYSGTVRVTSPELIQIDPGVMVVADADEPLFYAEGHYWLYRDGYWLRSNDYRRGFVRVELSYVPQRIRVIDRPQTYVQYRRHHQHRDLSARAPQQPTRSLPAPMPPPHQGVRSTPGPQTWQQPSPGVNPVPTRPRPTPPITAPADVHGTPMPNTQPNDVDRPPDSQMPVDRIPPGQDRRPATPPGQAGRPGPSDAPGNSDDVRGRGNENRGNENRGNSQGTASDRDDQATPPTPPSPGQGHGAKDDREKEIDKDKGKGQGKGKDKDRDY
jgi:hypothetical protein